MTVWAQKQKGFTIVELLIVVVVIAILAAITIVAYNGIQSRAKDSAAQLTADQATKKLLVYKVTNGGNYPADAAELATVLNLPSPGSGATVVTASDGTTYEYIANNSVSPRTYCLTTTKSGISFFTGTSNGNNATKGACPGHSANGVATVTNLVLNPRPNSDYWFASSTGVAKVTFVGSGLDSAARSTRVSTSGYALYSRRNIPVTTAAAGDTYTVLFTIVASKSTTIVFQVGYGTGTSTIGAVSKTIELTGGQPQTVRHTFTIPNGYDGESLFNKFYWGTGVGAVNDYFDVSRVMWVKGTYAGGYGDGDSPGWTWNGDANNATSIGPTI